MIEPPLERVLAKTDSRFGLVVLAARRARQINAYFNQLGEGIGSYVPPQVHSLSRKPVSISLEEIDNDKVVIQTDVPAEADQTEPGSEKE
jgi:DNA-directed RNA polymerase subunit omega